MAAGMSTDSFEVNVKDFQGRSVVIKVDPTWDVSRIKHEITRQTGVAPADFRIVFAGQTLADSQTLWDIGVQGYSTLHCIRFRGQGIDVKMATPLKKVAENLVAIDRTASRTATPHHSFYVYCKRPCENMAPGKLRVRCADCKDTSFLLHGGPGSWEDILTARKLQGHCNRQGCNGSHAEFFFKCAAHATQETEECVALYMIRLNTVQVDCASCLSKRWAWLVCALCCNLQTHTHAHSELVVVFNCPERHCLCVECFKEYITHELTNRKFIEKRGVGYTVRCPAGCEGSEVIESHHFRLMGKDMYDRYQKFGTEEFILQMGGVLCPHPNCGMGLLPDDMGRRVQCPSKEHGGCGFIFCRECKSAYHDGPCRQPSNPSPPGQREENGRGEEFQVSPENLERARWIQASEQFIETNTKPCPRCRVPVEKSGGCMHMTCGMASCRYEWCWICLVEWNRQCQATHWFG